MNVYTTIIVTLNGFPFNFTRSILSDSCQQHKTYFLFVFSSQSNSSLSLFLLIWFYNPHLLSLTLFYILLESRIFSLSISSFTTWTNVLTFWFLSQTVDQLLVRQHLSHTVLLIKLVLRKLTLFKMLSDICGWGIPMIVLGKVKWFPHCLLNGDFFPNTSSS